MLTSAVDLRAALAHNELELAYQPIFDVTRRTPRRVEAMISRIDAGVDEPEFVDITTLMRGGLGTAMAAELVTRFTLAESLAQVARWRQGRCDIPVSVNVSTHVLAGGWLLDYLDDLVHDTGLPYDSLTIELGGSADAVDLDAARPTVQSLSDRGIRISLDDFGSGAAGLEQLKVLPLDEIKIDPSFAASAHTSAVDRTIIVFCVHLAATLGLEVVANGVATEDSRRYLKHLGVHLQQGDYLYPPVPPDEVPVLFPIATVIDLRETLMSTAVPSR